MARATCTLLILLLGATAWARGGPKKRPKPTIGGVLAKVDEALFFHDRQAGLAGYDVELASWNGSAMPPGAKAQTDPKTAKKLAAERMRADEKTKVRVGGDGTPPGTFTPFCGPWTLTHVTAFQVELFSVPWSERFGRRDWQRAVRREGEGYELFLKPRTIVGNAQPLRPVLRWARIKCDAHGVPREATLGLDQEFIQDEGTLTFEYKENGSTLRIHRILARFRSANIGVNPALTFTWGKRDGFDLPARIEWRVAGSDLSGALRMMDMVTVLHYRAYRVERAPAPKGR